MLGVLLRRPQQRTLANVARLVTGGGNDDRLAVECFSLALVYAVCPVHVIIIFQMATKRKYYIIDTGRKID